MKKLIIFTAASMVFTLGYACTDFKITAKDGTVLIARSMEFAADMQANVRTSTRGRQFRETAPDGSPGMSWNAKYGYLFIDGFNQDYAVDGMNEAGLSYEALYLPGETQYQLVPAGKNSQALPYIRLGDWVLSNFKTIDEVRAALANMYVFSQSIPGMGSIVFPLHAAIFEPSGKGLVVEFVGGKMNIYDNIGVMTNSPTYDWQVVNLRNYLNLSPYVPKSLNINGMTYAATGQGSGMVGLPGDVSPPSRFVKVAALLNSAYSVSTAADALNLAQHVMNNVDIPLGFARARSQSPGKETADFTQWVDFKDLTHKMFYYRTYNDMTIHQISMAQVNFSEAAPRLKMPLADRAYVMDMTARFVGPTSQ